MKWLFEIKKNANMKTYTEQQVKTIIKQACAHQKFEDYQMAGNYLITNDHTPDIESTLNNLCDTDKTIAGNLDIEELLSN